MASTPRRPRDNGFTVTDFHLLRRDVDTLVDSMREIHTLITSDYITKKEFDPVEAIVYGAVKLVLGSVALSVLALVLTKTGVI